MHVPPARVTALATRVLHLWPEVRTTIEKRDQKQDPTNRGVGGGGNPTPANLTAVDAAHELHLALLQMLLEVDWQHDVPHRYRNPVQAAEEIRLYPTLLSEVDRIEGLLTTAEKHLSILEQEIDLPPEEIQLGECECGEPMVAREGDEEVQCSRCELLWEVEERHAHRRGRFLRTVATPMDAAAASRVFAQLGKRIPASTIRRWKAEGKLTPDKEGRFYLTDIDRVHAAQKIGRPKAIA